MPDGQPLLRATDSQLALRVSRSALGARREPSAHRQIIRRRRRAEFITPIPKPKKRKRAAAQRDIVFDEGKGLSTEKQQYDPTSIINELRQRVDIWRELPNPSQWHVTPETARLLQHWRHHTFSGFRPFFCQVEAVETAIWLTEVAPQLGKEGRRFLEHLNAANAQSNPGLARLALKLATGAGKTTVMAMIIAWQTINAVRRPNSRKFTRGFLVVAPGLPIRERLRVLQPNDPDTYFKHLELVPGDMLAERLPRRTSHRASRDRVQRRLDARAHARPRRSLGHAEPGHHRRSSRSEPGSYGRSASIQTAAARLRRHLEYVAADLADELGAKVKFRADGGYDMGELLGAVIGRQGELLKLAAKAAKSWDDKNEMAKVEKLQAARTANLTAWGGEQWVINKAILYNEWADLSRNDFKPVGTAFKELLRQFRCEKPKCDSWLSLTPRNDPIDLRCACGNLRLNFKEK
jgi:hypothetical protein